MFFDWALYVALIVFCIGLVHRIDTWLQQQVGIGDRNVSATRRLKAIAEGIPDIIFSRKILSVLKVFLVDILFQFNILKESGDPLAWVMHVFLFFGFVPLLLFHALGGLITVSLDPGYQPTVNPYLFLRNLWGSFVVAGLVLSVVRRAFTMKGRIHTTPGDVFVLMLLALIVGSGFLLEGLKITSHEIFSDMVDDYAVDPEPAEVKALEAYWVRQYGLVPPTPQAPSSAELLAQGDEISQASCMECHDRPQAAFVSYGVSRALKPVAAGLDRSGFRTMVRYTHFLLSFLGLACLAFGKMFHLIATPFSLVAAAISGPPESPAAAAARQMIERDGCSHGGICHDGCPIRKRRLERIDKALPYSPVTVFLDTKTTRALGSRKVSNQPAD